MSQFCTSTNKNKKEKEKNLHIVIINSRRRFTETQLSTEHL